MYLEKINIIPQGMSSTLSNHLSDSALCINRDSALSVENSSNKFFDVKYSTKEGVNKVEEPIYIDMSGNNAFLKEKIDCSDSDYVDINEIVNLTEKNKIIAKDVIVNKSITNKLIFDEDIMSDNSHKKLEEIYVSEFDRYFSLTQLINESERFISSEIQSLLEKEISVLEDRVKCELLMIKTDMMGKLSELVNNASFKNKFLQETQEISFRDLIFRNDGKNYYLTNIFSKILNSYYKDIDSSKVKDIKRINDISNAIISFSLAKYHKEGFK